MNSLETDTAPERESARAGAPLRQGAFHGLGAGLFAGLIVGAAEALVIAAGGLGREAQVLWYGPLAMAAVLGGVGSGVGCAAAAVLPFRADRLQGWVMTLALLTTFVPASAIVAALRLRSDLYLDAAPPDHVLTRGVVTVAACVFTLGLVGPRLFRGRMGELLRTPTVLVSLFGVSSAGAASAFLLGGDSLFAAPSKIQPALADRPNVVLVVVDSLRADALSCYGGRVETPAMCSLAEHGGSRFLGFTHASWTKPATATILSSQLPSSHGATSRSAALSLDTLLISEVMRGNGYASGAIVSSPELGSSFGFDQGYDEYHDLGPDPLLFAKPSSAKLLLHQGLRHWIASRRTRLRVEEFYPSAERVNEVAFDFLDRHEDSRFFLLLHYMDPHEPYFAHPWDGNGVARSTNERPDPSQAGVLRELYDGEVAYLDAQFAQLLETLKQRGLWDDTVIALVSDHGEEFHEHGGWWHGTTLYEEQLRVPFLVKWSQHGGVDGGDGTLARMLDVAPTLIGRTGARPPGVMQGVDLAETWGQRSPRERQVFAEVDFEGHRVRALRSETWKWIQASEPNPRGLPGEALHHMREDPEERDNRADKTLEIAETLAPPEGARELLARAKAVATSASTREAIRELESVP